MDQPIFMENVYQRLQARIAWPSNLTACWIWTGRPDQSGYGAISVGGKKARAHRIAYELFRGPIPDGLSIDHLCRVRTCVNPLHMEAVTMETNTLRGDSPQAINARKTACDSGHRFTPENTYQWVNRRGRTNRAVRACRACRDAASRRYKARRAGAG